MGNPWGNDPLLGDRHDPPDPHSQAVFAQLRRSEWAVLGSNQSPAATSTEPRRIVRNE